LERPAAKREEANLGKYAVFLSLDDYVKEQLRRDKRERIAKVQREWSWVVDKDQEPFIA